MYRLITILIGLIVWITGIALDEFVFRIEVAGYHMLWGFFWGACVVNPIIHRALRK